MKILLFFLDKDNQWLPFWSLFCKLNIRDLLFSIKGIWSFEKVPEKYSSFFNKLFIKILDKG